MSASLQQETAPLAFIGAGNMANAIIGGLIDQGYPAPLIRAADPNSDTLQLLRNNYGIATFYDNQQAIADVEAIVLAVKPQIMAQVLSPLAQQVTAAKPLIISIAAGITVNNIETWLCPGLPIVRTMPNTPALVQTGATGLYANAEVNNRYKAITTKIFEAIGIALWFDHEEDMDRVVALSGSGPAYFFLVMEAMEQAGVALGLTADVARQLTLQTALGAAKLALNDATGPAELRRRVTSPGGTTEAAIRELQAGGLERLFAQAINAASARSKALAG